MISLPRIRGKIGQASEPAELAGKWFFEIEVWDFEATKMVGDPIGPFGPFDTEKQAKLELEKGCKLAADAITEKMFGVKTGIYHDMKDGGKIKKWEPKHEL